MIEIKSNADTAQELAASLKSSGDALSGVSSASKDEQTKLSGNDAVSYTHLTLPTILRV